MSNKLWTPSSIRDRTDLTFTVNSVRFINAAARGSPLSKEQFKEIAEALPKISFNPIWVETTGDQDQKTSLRLLDKTDFFTKEVDEKILSGECRISIHSAKDLPHKIPENLKIIAITKGVDPSDSLVFRNGESLESLKPGAKVATSSERREEIVRNLREDLTFVDIRGTIEKRLEKLQKGEVDAVVIAEAALIRLQLTNLNRIKLPGETVPGQGQLAVLAKNDDKEMESLFSPLDKRATTLYLGLNCPEETITTKYLHFPVIAIHPRPLHQNELRQQFLKFKEATHLIFTSQIGVKLFFNALDYYDQTHSFLNQKTFVAVGKKTANKIHAKGFQIAIVPENETAEGIIEALKGTNNCRYFWPHSSLSRAVLCEHLSPLDEVILYDTKTNDPGPLPAETSFDSLLFTSPSTVDAYFELFGNFPRGKTIQAIGSITSNYLSTKNAFPR